MENFDPSKFSDDELNEKLTKLYSRYQYAKYSLKDNYLAEQILVMMDDLTFEKESRYKLSQWDKTKSNIVLETDPDLQPRKLEDNVKKSKSSNPFSRGPVIVKGKPRNI